MLKKIRKPKGDKLDRYRDHLLKGAKLKAEQEDMLSKYRRANALMCLGYSRMQTITILTKELELSAPQIYSILRESIELYGNVHKVDKDGMRYIMYENFMQAATLARKNEDHNAYIRALENAAEIYDLYNTEVAGINPAQFLRPSAIIFSSDPEVLKQQQFIDVDYEEE